MQSTQSWLQCKSETYLLPLLKVVTQKTRTLRPSYVLRVSRLFLPSDDWIQKDGQWVMSYGFDLPSLSSSKCKAPAPGLLWLHCHPFSTLSEQFHTAEPSQFARPRHVTFSVVSQPVWLRTINPCSSTGLAELLVLLLCNTTPHEAELLSKEALDLSQWREWLLTLRKVPISKGSSWLMHLIRSPSVSHSSTKHKAMSPLPHQTSQ